ncbi:MAG: protein kinase, partial [Chloroflexi bacterium]|nr:protein kinase [Chloroflexota bacterium]
MSDTRRIANRYELGKLIGRGGMGQVYQGLDLRTNTPVAIKVLRPDAVYTTPELVERFRREGDALRRLNHPNIVKVLDIIDEGNQNGEQYHYIVMEYVAGGSLAGLLQRQPQLPVERALAIALELSDALARTHHLNIVHRDIKPGNILLAEDGTPRLTDFGLAYMRDRERLTLAEAVVGTFAYLSPEACGGQKPDERSDIWSYGVVLYEMLAGRPPFQGDSPAEIIREIIDVTPTKVSAYRNDVPPALDNLVQRLLMKDAVARIGSFRQVGAELEAIIHGTRIPQWEQHPQASAAASETPQVELVPPHLWMKLYIPRLPGQWVDRQRLYDRLDQVKAGKIAVLSAPPGYGKTTLLVSWLCHSGWKNVGWLSLDAGDNDPVRFWSYLVAALQMIPACKGVGSSLVELIRSPQPPPLEAGLTMLLNEITQVSEDLLLVLDDYHTITNAAIHSGLDFCLEHLPPHLHLVIASRTAPAFALPRYRARGRLVELRAGDLRFTPQEAREFLQQAAHQQLSVDDIAALEQRTEGWIAGMQLAALLMEGMEGCEDAHAFVQSFSGDQHYILDYLTEEVLRRQPEPVQSFLLQSAILDRMTAPLCDFVLEIGGSQAMLDHLEQANLFVVPLDNRRAWYRYHQLFAELLRARLRQADPEQHRRLHRRAAEWFAAHQMPDEAIKHALAGEDLNRAAELVAANQSALIEHGEAATLHAWLHALPKEVVLARPSLSLGHAWLELYQSHFEQAGRWADLACAAMGAQPDDALRSQVDAVRATVAINQRDFGQAAELSRRALQNLPTELGAIRSVVNLNLGDAYA